MSTGQDALRARYRNLSNDLLLTVLLRRNWIFHSHLTASAFIPLLAIRVIDQGAREDGRTIILFLFASWLFIGGAWLMLGRAAHPRLIQAAYRNVGSQLTPPLHDLLAIRLNGECPKPMSIHEVVQAMGDLIASDGPKAAAKAARLAQRVAAQRAAIEQQGKGGGDA
jgi:hypothetical protein